MLRSFVFLTISLLLSTARAELNCSAVYSPVESLSRNLAHKINEKIQVEAPENWEIYRNSYKQADAILRALMLEYPQASEERQAQILQSVEIANMMANVRLSDSGRAVRSIPSHNLGTLEVTVGKEKWWSGDRELKEARFYAQAKEVLAALRGLGVRKADVYSIETPQEGMGHLGSVTHMHISVTETTKGRVDPHSHVDATIAFEYKKTGGLDILKASLYY